MRGILLALAVATAAMPCGAPLHAQASRVEAMQTADDARGWLSVGKLLLGERGFCTAVLIEPQLVLTAAHCLYDKDTGARIPDQSISFQAGWRNGRAEAYRAIRRALAHPDYVYSGRDQLERVGVDLAILELDQPILMSRLQPFATGMRPPQGASVSVVSYAQDRSEAPSIERDCTVLDGDRSALVLSCDIDFGSSGAPVFRHSALGTEVVSVISAKAEYGGQKVALAVPIAEPLEVLRAQMAIASAGRGKASGVRSLSGGTADQSAKFARP